MNSVMIEELIQAVLALLLMVSVCLAVLRHIRNSAKKGSPFPVCPHK